MATRPVGRPKKGAVREHGSDTALFAHVTYKLAGLTSKDVEDIAAQFGLHVSASAILHAGREHPAAAGGPPLLRRWVLVSERDIGLSTALVRLAPRSVAPDDDAAAALYAAVGAIAGVRQVMMSEARPEVFAVVLTDNPADADRLRDELGRAARVLSWEPIRRETFEPAAGTWGHLAQLRAVRDGLLR